MRIISGSAGGIPLKVPKAVARPTADRVRESLFSVLGSHVVGVRVLDLFAGSGALGIEALSRGAAGAVFVEQHRQACSTIRENLAKARLDGSGKVVTADAFRFLDRRHGGTEFGILFADPPYHKSPGDRDFGAELLAAPGLRSLASPGAFFVLETAAGQPHDSPQGWQLIDQRTYGSSTLWFFQAPTTEGDGGSAGLSSL